MAIGKVKWFNPTKGYGFIEPNESGPDVFVHIRQVERSGLTGLAEGQHVSYDLVKTHGRTSAGNIQLVNKASAATA